MDKNNPEGDKPGEADSSGTIAEDLSKSKTEVILKTPQVASSTQSPGSNPGSNPGTAKSTTSATSSQQQPVSTHIRIPSVTAQLRPTPLPSRIPSSSPSLMPRVSTGISTISSSSSVTSSLTSTITINRPVTATSVVGHHRLPMAPVMSSPGVTPGSLQISPRAGTVISGGSAGAANKANVPVSLTVLQQPMTEPAKLTVVQADNNVNRPAGMIPSQATSIRPGSVTLTSSGFPVTLRSPAPGAKHGTIVTNNPAIQLVNLSSTPGQNTARLTGPIISPSANLRQNPTVVKAGTTTNQVGSLSNIKSPEQSVCVTLSSATISKFGPGTGNFYKPVTITSQPIAGTASSIMRPGGLIQNQPVRIGLPAGSSRMTLIPNQSVSVAISPGGSAGATASQQQPQMARIITQGNNRARLISMTPTPQSASSVSIQKAVTMSGHQSSATITAGKTISLPLGSNQITVPKPLNDAARIPVARVIPQLSGTLQGPTGETNLFVTRTGPNMQQIQHIAPVSDHVTISSTSGGPTSLSMVRTAAVGSKTQIISHPQTLDINRLTTSPSRPGILRRREGEREIHCATDRSSPTPQVRPDSRDGGGSSSGGSTTLSATSSPTNDNANLSGNEDQQPNNNVGGVGTSPSPRKKPRKQQHVNVREPGWSENEDLNSANLKRKMPSSSSRPFDRTGATNSQQSALPPAGANYPVFKNKPQISLSNSYRHTWKSRHNHFLRYSDVKPKDERRPTVNELSSQSYILQKIDGWKIHLLSTQMTEIVEIEVDLNSKLSQLQKKLDKLTNKDLSRDVGNLQETVKANLQRSKIIRDQVNEAQSHTMQILNHKGKVKEIINRYITKRQIRKRDLRV